MWILSIAIYLSLKWLTWWRARSRIAHAAWRSVAYLLAWPGCRCFLGCESPCIAASRLGLALRGVRDHSRCNPALGSSAIDSARTTASARVGRNGGPDPAPSLWYFPHSRSPVAEPWGQSRTHHV